jgi:hypothetical protein
MDNVITEKRGLVIILVVATVVIFVGLVWGITKFLPLNIFGSTSPSHTPDAPVAGRNCTYPVTYWQEHPERYPSQLVIGGQVYKAKDVGGILSDDPQDIARQLQAQLTGAYLNFLAGADQNKIEATIFEAYGWLVRNPAGIELTDNEREAGNRLLNILTAYNLGLTDVPACEPGLTLTVAGISTITQTAELLLTTTPSDTPTATPSETPTPTNYPTEPISTLAIPSRTPIPTTSIPRQPSVTPSQTLSPPTTEAPVSTTEVPTATFTPTIHPRILQHLLIHHLHDKPGMRCRGEWKVSKPSQ